MSRIMGIDYGVKRIGVAVSDPLGVTAQPLEVIQRKSVKEDIARIKSLAETGGIVTIVIGFPYNMDGTPGALADEVTAFGDKVKAETGLPVEFYDERMTTLQVDRMLTEEADVSREKRRQVRDKLAASLILQSYLQSKG